MAQTDRSQSFCTHAIRQADPLIIRDAREDPRVNQLAIVTGAPHFRFYCGIPIRSPDGYAIGTLCVLDDRVRDLSPSSLDALKLLARQAEDELAMRRALHELKEQRGKAEATASAKDDMASHVVHDLKGALAGIMAHAGLLLNGTIMDAGDRESARDIVAAASQMNRLLMNLLDIRQAEDGRLPVRRVRSPLRTIVEAAAATTRGTLLDRKQAARVEVDAIEVNVERRGGSPSKSGGHGLSEPRSARVARRASGPVGCLGP